MAKVKLDISGIKNWGLAHGEKLAFGIVAIVFLLFAYSAISREVLDAKFDANNLKQKADSVSAHVAGSRWDPQREQVRLVEYLDRAKSKDVVVEHFPLKPLNPPATDPKAKRGVPEVLPAEELRVAAGIDLFRVRQARAGAGDGAEDLKAQPWVVLTAVVPYRKQVEQFDAMFANAVGYSKTNDVPKYFAPLLQRAEVLPSQANPGEWKDVPFTSIKTFEEQWRGPSQELAHPDFIHDQLTGKLGDLVSGKWGEEVGHPKVPLRSELRAPATPAATAEGDGVPGEKPAEPAPPAGRFAPAPALTQRPAPPQAPGAVAAKPAEEQLPTEHYLLRVFDYTVEPGKKYRYRVVLGIVNPNQGKPVHELKDPGSATATQLESQPSAPTEIVSVPDGHGVLAGPVKAGSKYSEPTATIQVTAIDRQSGLKAGTELVDVHRGAIGNTEPRKVVVPHPLNKAEKKEVTLGFTSNFVVLDIYGGDSLPGRAKQTAPGEVLLLDASGKLVVRSELDDAAQYTESIVKEEPPEKRRVLGERDKDDKNDRDRAEREKKEKAKRPEPRAR